MRSSSVHALLAATLAATSSAFDFGQNDVTQTAGTVSPGQATDSLTPTSVGGNGFGNFGAPPSTASSSAWTPSGEQPTGPGNQGWPQQQGGRPSPSSYWNPNSGDQHWPRHGGWKSGLSEYWAPPSGDQGQGTLGVDCSGSGGGGWTPPGGDQGWGTLSVDCSGSGEGMWTPPTSDQGSRTLGVDCSGSSDGEWTPPNGDQGFGTLGVDCSGSSSGAGLSLAGSNTVEGSQEAAGSTTSSTTESSGIASTTSSGIGDQGPLPSTKTSSGTGASLTSSSTGDQGWPKAEQTASAESSTDGTTSTESSVGADADHKTMLRSASSSAKGSNQIQQQQQQQTYTSTSQSDVIQSMSVSGGSIVAETGTNHSSAKPTFGKITSKPGECVVASPTEYISEKYLDWVWDNRIGPNADVSNKANWNVMANKNFHMDKLVHNNGSLNYCVRWDAKSNLDKNKASKFQAILERHFDAWNDWLVGYNCWPFTEVKVNMVGWAANQASQFGWSDESLGKIYEGDVGSDGAPQCPDECYRYYDNVNNVWSDTSACKGEPFDMSFWLKEDIPYGFGYDWGQEVSLNNTLKNLYDRNIMFIGHEIGHGFGLPDFYGLETKPAKDFPNAIMMAYSSTTITPSDGWMLRRILDHVRSRYKF
ncbi:Neutral zinc metallopeptidase, Zn-binding site [Phytophthora cinnamomi]|uniref:Neutral zinc metallopeptidase, Zn-binding site n=1 Tax=Phytophthora cinnamomi TaxID=4785 RepID=UPI00355947DE|nr:Neutral zinc metallopeptidase, Zn-binding site [Phytophthora cinnamomi]